jgi:hypothetical protein
MRWLAFTLFALAALDLGIPGLDRTGLALAGLACLALALPPRPRRIRRPAFLNVPPATIELADEPADELDDLPARIAAYAGGGRTGP